MSQYNNNGYRYVKLNCMGKRRSVQVHRLVLEAFRGPSELLTRHLNDVKHDNRLSNLTYGTQQDNMNDRVYVNTWNPQILDSKTIAEIRSSRLTQVELAAKYNVSKTTINNVIHGRNGYS